MWSANEAGASERYLAGYALLMMPSWAPDGPVEPGGSPRERKFRAARAGEMIGFADEFQARGCGTDGWRRSRDQSAPRPAHAGRCSSGGGGECGQFHPSVPPRAPNTHCRRSVVVDDVSCLQPTLKSFPYAAPSARISAVSSRWSSIKSGSASRGNSRPLQ